MNTPFYQAIAALEPERLKFEDTGSAVEALQVALKELSLYRDRVDGYFGINTAEAVRSLQTNFGLSETGQFDAAAWYALTFWAEPPASSSHSNKSTPPLAQNWQIPFLKVLHS